MSTPSDSKGYALEYSIVKASDHAVLGGVRSTGGASVAAATTLSTSDSGNTFYIDQDASFAITLPQAADMAGCTYRFVLTDAGTGAVTIALGGTPAATVFQGVLLNATAAGALSGDLITFVASTAVVGDFIEVEGLTSTFVHVRGSTSASGGITVT